MSFTLSSKHGNITLIEDIGHGSFSSVALAEISGQSKHVCAKIIPMEHLRRKKLEDMINREIEIMKKVDHPNIVKYYDDFSTPDNQFKIIITEYYEDDLFDLINSDSLTESEKQQIAKGIIQAICYLHRMGIVHLDIKIENIMLNGLTPVLCDFEFARENVNEPDYATGVTYLYAAPEFYQKTKIDLFKMDIWALGITLYMIATCDTDFYISDFEIIKDRTLYKELPINTDDILQNIAARCLIKDPKQRPSILDLINDDYLKFFFN